MKLSHRIMRILILLLLGLIAISVSLWIFILEPALKSSEQGKADMFVLANEIGLGHMLESMDTGHIQTYIDQLMLLRDPNTNAHLLNGVELTTLTQTFTQIRTGTAEHSFISETILFSSDKDRRFLGSVKVYYADTFYRKLQYLGNTTLIFSIIFFSLLLLIVFLFMEKLLKPLTELTRQLLKIDTEVEYKIPPLQGVESEEISLVKNALDRLLELLQQHREELENRVQIRTVELNDARERAEMANRAKSDFLANMSHEIRTPLNAIAGIVELSLREKLSPKVKEYMYMVKNASDSLLGIINDVLDFSKIEAGKMELENQPFDLNELLNNMIDVFRKDAADKKIELKLSVAPETPTILDGDAVRLGQVLTNLVANALKFTEQGEISIATELLRERGSQVRIRFTVTDSGIGIESEKIEALFDSFTQADNSITRKYGGSGLGLAICSRLVKMMGGSFSVKSRPGEGSTFAFTSEFRKTERSALQQKPTHEERAANDIALNNISLLLVDDNPINRKIMSRLLEAEGMQITLASNGQKAVDKIQQESFDVVLMDMQMPVLSGIDATIIIREQLGLTDLPIIALTANALKEDMERCLDAGMNDFIAKPINSEDVKAKIIKWLNKRKKV